MHTTNSPVGMRGWHEAGTREHDEHRATAFVLFRGTTQTYHNAFSGAIVQLSNEDFDNKHGCHHCAKQYSEEEHDLITIRRQSKCRKKRRRSA